MTTIYDDLNTAISMCKEGSDIHDLLVAVSDALLRTEAELQQTAENANFHQGERDEYRIECDILKALLAQARDEGIDDAWITCEEGKQWLCNVNEALGDRQ